MDNLVSILKMPALNREVKEAILRYTQNWSYAFEGKSSLSYVEQVYKTLKTEGELPGTNSVRCSDGETQASPSHQETSLLLHLQWSTLKPRQNG